MTTFPVHPLAGCLAFLALFVLIAALLLPFLLWLLPVLLALWALWWVFGPRPVVTRYDAAPPEPEDDIPASEAVIDVEARVVEDSSETEPQTDRKGG